MASYNALFPLLNSWLLVLSLGFGIVSIFFFFKEQYTIALVCLFISGVLLRLFIAHLDPFLHLWDERYHALVARNMMHHPFKPMLRISEWIKYDYRQWCCNHVWLHKQPLFMWQMALSMKIFGVSEFAIRYPAVLMGSISILLVYRIAHLMTANKQIAFISAVLVCYAYFGLELLSGMYGMDQNDSAFDFYVLCSFWAFAEFSHRRGLRYAILIGLFAGCAILNKWLVGTLVFAAWGVVALFYITKKEWSKEIQYFFVACLTCVVVALPWQLYILHRFPTEAHYEFAYNSKHLTTAVEGHTGDSMYYIDYFDKYFGQCLWWLVPVGAILLLLKKNRNQLSCSVLAAFVIGFVFFNYIAATKIAAYFMVVVPLGHILIAMAIFRIIHHQRVYKFIVIPVTITCALVVLNLSDITSKRDPNNTYDSEPREWVGKTHNNTIYKNIVQKLPTSVRYAINVRDDIDFMFYNNHIDAYRWIGTAELEDIKRRHKSILIFHDSGVNDIPSCLLGYDSAYIIPVVYK